MSNNKLIYNVNKGRDKNIVIIVTNPLSSRLNELLAAIDNDFLLCLIIRYAERCFI